MTYIYTHFFSNGNKYVGISNVPKNRWKQGFDPSDPKQYNHKVLIANEKYDRLSFIISENLPRRIAEKMESILINSDDTFNLNIKKEIPPNLHGNDVICIHTENFSHVYPKIDGEILYHSPEIEENNNRRLSLWKKEREKERLKKLKDEKRKEEEKERKIELEKQREMEERLDRLSKQKRENERLNRLSKQNGVTIDEIQRLERLSKQNRVTIEEIQRLERLAKQNGVTITRQKRIEELVEQSRQTGEGIERLEMLAKTKGILEENTIRKEIAKQKRERQEEITSQEREKERLKKLKDEKRKEEEKERKIELEKQREMEERWKKLEDETRKEWKKERLARLAKQKSEDERLDRLGKQNGVTIEEVEMLEELAKRNLIDMPNSEGVYTTNRFVHINFQIKGTEDLKRIESEIKEIKKMENLMIPIIDIQEIFNELDEFKKKVEQGLEKIYSSTESRSNKIKIFEDLKNQWEEIRSKINNSKIELKFNFNTLKKEFKKINNQAVRLDSDDELYKTPLVGLDFNEENYEYSDDKLYGETEYKKYQRKERDRKWIGCGDDYETEDCFERGYDQDDYEELF